MNYSDLLEKSWEEFRDGALPKGLKDDMDEEQFQSVRWVFWSGIYEIARLLFTGDPHTLEKHQLLEKLHAMTKDVGPQRMKYHFCQTNTKAAKKKRSKKEKPEKEPCTFAHDLGLKINIPLEFE